MRSIDVIFSDEKIFEDAKECRNANELIELLNSFDIGISIEDLEKLKENIGMKNNESILSFEQLSTVAGGISLFAKFKKQKMEKKEKNSTSIAWAVPAIRSGEQFLHEERSRCNIPQYEIAANHGEEPRNFDVGSKSVEVTIEVTEKLKARYESNISKVLSIPKEVIKKMPDNFFRYISQAVIEDRERSTTECFFIAARKLADENKTQDVLSKEGAEKFVEFYVDDNTAYSSLSVKDQDKIDKIMGEKDLLSHFSGFLKRDLLRISDCVSYEFNEENRSVKQTFDVEKFERNIEIMKESSGRYFEKKELYKALTPEEKKGLWHGYVHKSIIENRTDIDFKKFVENYICEHKSTDGKVDREVDNQKIPQTQMTHKNLKHTGSSPENVLGEVNKNKAKSIETKARTRSVDTKGSFKISEIGAYRLIVESSIKEIRTQFLGDLDKKYLTTLYLNLCIRKISKIC